MTSSDSHLPYAVIVGADDVRGLYAARHLARHSVPLIAVLKDRWSPGGWSRLWDRTIIADTDSEEVVTALERLGPSLGQKAVLIPCFDTVVLHIARHRQRLERWFHVVQPSPDAVETMIDKVRFYRFALEFGFPLPQTAFLDTRSDVEAAARHLTFPVVVKPPMSKRPNWQHRTNLKALKAASIDDLYQLFDAYRAAADGPLIAQDWVPGGDDQLYGCQCCFASDGRVLASFTCRKVRQWPPEVGDASLAEEIGCDEVRDLAIKVFSAFDYRGLGELDVKRDPRSGRYFLIEPNLRVSGWMGLAEAGGVSLIHTMYRDAIGERLSATQEQRPSGVKWIWIQKDLQAAFASWRTHSLTVGKWLRSLRGIRAFGIWSWTDPGPFIGDIVRTAGLAVRGRGRAKRGARREC